VKKVMTAPALPTEDELLVPSEVARILKVSENTLAIWRHHRRGPDFLKLGRQVRYEDSVIQEFKEACRKRCDPVGPRQRSGRR